MAEAMCFPEAVSRAEMWGNPPPTTGPMASFSNGVAGGEGTDESGHEGEPDSRGPQGGQLRAGDPPQACLCPVLAQPFGDRVPRARPTGSYAESSTFQTLSGAPGSQPR